MTVAASVGTVTDEGDGRWSWSLASGDVPAGTRTVYLTATDDNGLRDQAAFDLDMENVAPEVRITHPVSGSAIAVGSSTAVSASVVDPGAAPLSCRFDWDDGRGPGPPVPVVDGACSDARRLGEAGVYEVTVTASDGEGGTGGDTTTVAVYDPAGGFVTGSGTVDSGQADFDVSVRYVNSRPIGQVVLRHQATGFAFAASTYEWLVAAGARAQVRGSGMVGGVSGYDFLLTVFDGTAGGGPDRFRLKVWTASTGAVVYDDMPGASDDLDAANTPPITSGSIVVHKT